MTRAALGLGGNLGNVAETFHRALDLLADQGVVKISLSSFYGTRPIGPRAGGEFLNAVAAVETELSPIHLLKTLQTIEENCWRTRAEFWGPRTLDLDLLCMEDLVLETPELVLPHPHLWYRRFVLEPLFEVWPDWLHPLANQTIRSLVERFQKRPLKVYVAKITPELENRVKREFGSSIELLRADYHGDLFASERTIKTLADLILIDEDSVKAVPFPGVNLSQFPRLDREEAVLQVLHSVYG